MTQQNPASPDGEFVSVPKRALEWLLGEGPDEQGHWFGDGDDPAGRRGRYWWRTQFCNMLASAPRPDAGDMAAFGASDYACYKYPGDNESDQAKERAAFCAGAAWQATAGRPDADAKLAEIREIHASDDAEYSTRGGNVVALELHRHRAYLLERAAALGDALDIEGTAASNLRQLVILLKDNIAALEAENERLRADLKLEKKLDATLGEQQAARIRQLQSAASEALQECERLRAEVVMLRDERAFYAKGDHSMTQAWARQRRAFERIETADTSQQMRDIAREQLSVGQPRRALGAAK